MAAGETAHSTDELMSAIQAGLGGGTAEAQKVEDLARIWRDEARTVKLWRPLQASGAVEVNLPPRADLKVFEGMSLKTHRMAEGVLVSGFVLDINLEDDGSIALQDGSYRIFGRTEGQRGELPVISSEAQTVVDFERAWIEGLFRHPRGAEKGVLLATVAMQEVAHPDELTSYPLPA